MKKYLIKFLCFVLVLTFSTQYVHAQKGKKRTAAKRPPAQSKKTKGKTKGTNNQTATIDSLSAPTTSGAIEQPIAQVPLPIAKVKKSLRPDEAVETKDIKERVPLNYEHLRADDAVYRHKIWREIDTREKINMPFRYTADENNGNQRFISILLKAVADSVVTVFEPIDDRFTTPMTVSQVAKMLGGGIDTVDIYGPDGTVIRRDPKVREINLDSFYKFKIKEEVVFDKEASRLFWRILGIAPVRNVYSSIGDFIGTQDVFWVYYPDMRPTFALYETYNGKNFGARMTWEELFESRAFSGRIIKSTIDNPSDIFISSNPGLKDNTVFQLLEGERIKEKIFNYELDLWSY
jgi:gliding motility associated protien GldN